MSDDFLAELYLYKSGLNRQEQKDVFQKAGGKWDPDKIQKHLQTVYRSVELNDGVKVMAGKNFKKGLKKTWITGVTPLEAGDLVDGDVVRLRDRLVLLLLPLGVRQHHHLEPVGVLVPGEVSKSS